LAPATLTSKLSTLSLHDALPILLRFADGAHERHHHFHIGKAHHIAHFLQRTTLKLETLAEVLADITRRTTEAEHRVFFMRLVQRSEEHTSELQSRENLVCRLLLE